MTRVKICGLRRFEDVEYVNRYSPDYIGFVFAESRRRVNASRAAELVKILDPGIKKVGVFVNADIGDIVNAVNICGLDVLQLSGDENAEYVRRLSVETDRKLIVWKGIRVFDNNSVEEIDEFQVDAFLLDSYVRGSYGGSGKAFDWEIAAKTARHKKVILAGGLNCENVRNAIGSVRPFAVDVSSGVETDGCKDESKIAEFIRLVREKTVR